MKLKKGQLEITIISIVIGIMIVMQYKSVTQLGGAVSNTRAQELAAQLSVLEKEKKSLNTQINNLKDKIEEYENQFVQDNRVVEDLRKDTQEAKILAGQTAVKGPGIVITLDYIPLEEGDDFNPFLMYPEYLLILLNELNSAGAEAISINDQRIISTSEIRLAGNHIVINGQKFSHPFIFKVIGDSQTMESAIQLKGGVVELLNSVYIQVNIKREQEVVIPKYEGVIEYEYAKPIEE
ncbi:DUF881 domain-containing protein [Garciella nitratireducens]|uniref:Uncharacterized conserved protein YlxW, UPF0749 family n=1 Tax=Garciella nitratireducens DSM 15102 TaxID=1121911 RepID=A0A1T4JTH6_9FIRM|nr:DUF881 domain-containing protein [Garciella nitratireducens]RBP45558.1 uncharacterized protein YlxW (UPF0749 family) [Garciella nitratireducens]SJZ33441.1 Uncharacterized conserved protein YlxW, UPF0749 family [Garciella nitratireducens DSM 15102]